MTNALSTRGTTDVGAHNGSQQTEQILNSDVIVPKLLLMQGLSDLVVAKKYQGGEMVRSTTEEKLGDEKTGLEFIPLTFVNQWILKELVGKKYEFRKYLPRRALFGADATADAKALEEDKIDENLPWEFKKNGAEWKRIKVLSVFALLPGDLLAFKAELARAEKEGTMPDINKAIMPVVISFQSSSYKAGKGVVSHFTKAKAMAKMGTRAHGYTLKLDCYLDKNDQGSFYVYKVSQGRACTKDEYATAQEWYDILGSKAVTVDDSDEKKPEEKRAMNTEGQF